MFVVCNVSVNLGNVFNKGVENIILLGIYLYFQNGWLVYFCELYVQYKLNFPSTLNS